MLQHHSDSACYEFFKRILASENSQVLWWCLATSHGICRVKKNRKRKTEVIRQSDDGVGRVQLDCTPSTRTRKINPLTNQKCYENFETTIGKLLAKRIQICGDCFCKDRFDLFFQNKFPNHVRTKIVSADLDFPRQILLFRDLRPFWGASDRWQIILLVF